MSETTAKAFSYDMRWRKCGKGGGGQTDDSTSADIKLKTHRSGKRIEIADFFFRRGKGGKKIRIEACKTDK